jgi:hypothetical protein
MRHFDSRTRAALAHLREKGISPDDPVHIGGSASNILGTITNALSARPNIDAIWIISDFNDGTDLVTKSGDRSGYEQLMKTIHQRQIRIYLSTVNVPPTNDQIQAAEESGGGWSTFK